MPTELKPLLSQPRGIYYLVVTIILQLFFLINAFYAQDRFIKPTRNRGLKPSYTKSIESRLNQNTSLSPEPISKIKWVEKLGSQTYSSPVIADGKVFIGTNNYFPRNPFKVNDMGVLMAFSAADGEFLWQSLSKKLKTGSAQDWPRVGVCSTPLVVRDRIYYISNRAELLCLDTEGFLDEENDGPFSSEAVDPQSPDIIWTLNLIKELGVYPHNASNSSPVSLGNILFVGTSNGRNSDHSRIPSPKAPSLIAVNMKSGKLIWEDNSPGVEILHGQWSSPYVSMIGNIAQVIMGQGDGWVRSFEAHTGRLLWEFDTNPKESIYPFTRNSILATPGVWNDLVYIANGQDPDHGQGKANLYCIDATKRGDITESGLVWSYSGINRSLSKPVFTKGLVFYPDLSGFLHCLDAKTGELYWIHDFFSSIWGSPIISGEILYLGDEDGDIVSLKTGKKKMVLSENNLGSSIFSTPAVSNKVLYIATSEMLFSISITE